MNKIEKLKEIIDSSDNIVFFGGAGVSTESGVPDFRSKDGLYNQHDIRFDSYSAEYLLSHSCLEDNANVFFEFYRQKLDARNIEPNYAHIYLAELEKIGKLKAVVTQNIDGLHQKAGSKTVYELHGTTLENYCSRCGKKYNADAIYDSSQSIPKCSCGGTIRPNVTLYEEPLPVEHTQLAIEAIREANVLIIGGTSLCVYPAASFVNYFNGTHLVIINRESLGIKLRDCDLEINDSIGKVFKELSQLS